MNLINYKLFSILFYFMLAILFSSCNTSDDKKIILNDTELNKIVSNNTSYETKINDYSDKNIKNTPVVESNKDDYEYTSEITNQSDLKNTQLENQVSSNTTYSTTDTNYVYESTKNTRLVENNESIKTTISTNTIQSDLSTEQLQSVVSESIQTKNNDNTYEEVKNTTVSTPTINYNDPVLFLSVNNDKILIGHDDNELSFNLLTNLNADSIKLYVSINNSEYVFATQMYDDCDYMKNGDTIAGDGIYSAKYISNITEKSTLSFIAKSDANESNVVDVNYYVPISDETISIMKNVDEILEKVAVSEDYLNGDEEVRKDLIMTALKKLELDHMIIEGSITYGEGVFCFEYVGGILGGFMIREWHKDFN